MLLGLIGLQLISQAGNAGRELLDLDAEVPEAWAGSGVRIEPRPASAKIVRRKLLTICTGNPPFYQQQ